MPSWITMPIAIAILAALGLTGTTLGYKLGHGIGYNRGYEAGDVAGYSRKAKEIADATAHANDRIEGSNGATATDLAANSAARQALVAQVQAETRKTVETELSRETAEAKSDAKAASGALDTFKEKYARLLRSKTRIVEKPVVKVKKVFEHCGVGNLMTLNQIQ